MCATPDLVTVIRRSKSHTHAIKRHCDPAEACACPLVQHCFLVLFGDKLWQVIKVHRAELPSARMHINPWIWAFAYENRLRSREGQVAHVILSSFPTLQSEREAPVKPFYSNCWYNIPLRPQRYLSLSKHTCNYETISVTALRWLLHLTRMLTSPLDGGGGSWLQTASFISTFYPNC